MNASVSFIVQCYGLPWCLEQCLTGAAFTNGSAAPLVPFGKNLPHIVLGSFPDPLGLAGKTGQLFSRCVAEVLTQLSSMPLEAMPVSLVWQTRLSQWAEVPAEARHCSFRVC